MELVLGVWDFVLLVLGLIGLVLVLVIVTLEYHYWRTRRRVKSILSAPGTRK